MQHDKIPKIHLTSREREVLQLIADGLRTEEIATRLNISSRMVNNLHHHIYTKMGVSSYIQAVHLAQKLNMLPMPPGFDSEENTGHAQAEPSESSSWVWDSPRVKAILERPEGTPIDLSGLTQEERAALFREARGMWSDHPYIRDSVEWVRGLREGLSKSFQENN